MMGQRVREALVGEANIKGQTVICLDRWSKHDGQRVREALVRGDYGGCREIRGDRGTCVVHDGAVTGYADNGHLDVDEAGSRGVHDDEAGQANVPVLDVDDGLDDGGVPVVDSEEGVDGGGAVLSHIVSVGCLDTAVGEGDGAGDLEFDEAGDEGVVEHGEVRAGAIEGAQAVHEAVHGDQVVLEESRQRLCTATGQTHMLRVVRKV